MIHVRGEPQRDIAAVPEALDNAAASEQLFERVTEALRLNEPGSVDPPLGDDDAVARTDEQRRIRLDWATGNPASSGRN
jgi:hypothetical protein